MTSEVTPRRRKWECKSKGERLRIFFRVSELYGHVSKVCNNTVSVITEGDDVSSDEAVDVSSEEAVAHVRVERRSSHPYFIL